MPMLTKEDLEAAGPLADQILGLATKERPGTAVAGVARALAALAHLAKCGPEAPLVLYRNDYAAMERLK
jgi:hypothetical protein